MKHFILAGILSLLATSAMAQGEGTALSDMNGSNQGSDTIYASPCHAPIQFPSYERRDTLGKIWGTWKEAASQCNHDEQVIGTYYFDKGMSFGYTCVPRDTQGQGPN